MTAHSNDFMIRCRHFDTVPGTDRQTDRRQDDG